MTRILLFLLLTTQFSFAEVLRLNLEQVIDLVVQNDRALMNADDRLRQSEITLENVRSTFDLKSNPYIRGGVAGGGTAGTNPAYGGGYAFTKKFSRGTQVQVTPSMFVSRGIYRDHNRIIKGERTYEANVNAIIRQPLLKGINREFNLNSVHSSEFAYRNELRQRHQAEVRTIVNAVMTAYQAVRSAAALELKEQALENLQNVVRTARLKEKIGMADAMDIYRAELDYTQAQENLEIAQESYQDLLDRLKEMMNLPLDTELVVSAPLDIEEIELAPRDAIEIALESRIEIDQMKDAVDNALRLERIASHNKLPQLDWVFNYSAHAKDQVFTRAWAHLNTNKWGIGVAAEGDFEFAMRRRTHEASEINIRIAERQLVDVENNITLEVKREFRNLSRARTRIESQEDRLKKAEGRLKLAEMKFERGLANNFDVVQAEAQRHAAAEALIGAITEYIVGTYRLRQAVGTLLEKPHV